MNSENEQVLLWYVFGTCVRIVVWIAFVCTTMYGAALISGWLYTIVGIMWCCYWIAKFWVFAGR